MISNNVTPSIGLLAIAEDLADKTFYGVVKFRDVDGKTRKLTIPKAELNRPRELRSLLENAGCCFSGVEAEDIEAIKELSDYSGDIARWQFAKSVGWQGRHQRFVRPRSVIGAQPKSVVLKPPRIRRAHHLGVADMGSLKNWKEKVARPAARSSRIVCQICAGFGAMTLDFAGVPSFIINVYGPSKVGKSTGLLAASSLYGYGCEPDLPNFRTTDAAFGEIPASFNDMMMPINELGLLSGSRRGRFERLCELAYCFAEGSGTTYSEKYLVVGASERKRWRSIGIVNGETSFDEMAAQAGAARPAGTAIRLVDLPAIRKGSPDIFDRAPRKISGEERSPWFNRRCDALRQACRRNRGHAAKKFIKCVISNPEQVRKDLRRLRNKFVKEVVKLGEPEQVIHLAKCFGHIFAAGILAARFKIVPWSEPLIFSRIRTCYRDARRVLRLEADLLKHGLRTIRGLFNDPEIMRVVAKNKGAAGVSTAIGFIEDEKRGCRLTVRGDRFKEAFDDGREAAIVLRWLTQHGALLSAQRRRAESDRSVTWAESQRTWPDGVRRRSIVILWRPDVEAAANSVAAGVPHL